MNQIAPVDPHQFSATFFDYLHAGAPWTWLDCIFGVALAFWLLQHFLRVSFLAEQIAFLAASTFPAFFSILIASLKTIDLVDNLGNKGIADPAHTATPVYIAQSLGEILTTLVFGSAVTCIFLVLGILTILFRPPRSSPDPSAIPFR